MTKFINSLISRHSTPEQNVKPRLRGRFEATESGTNSSMEEESVNLEKTVNQTTDISEQTESEIVFNRPESEEETINSALQTPIIHEEKLDDLLIPEKVKKGAIPEIENPLAPVFSQSEEVSKDLTYSSEGGTMTTPESTGLNADWTENSKENISLENIAGVKNALGNFDQEVKNPVASNSPIPFSGEQENYFGEEQLNIDESYSPLINQSIPTELQNKAEEQPLFPADQNRENGSLLAMDNFKSLSIEKEPSAVVAQAPESPVIKVSIGQINIRSRVQAAPPVRPKKSAPVKPKLSLSDYLKKQNQ